MTEFCPLCCHASALFCTARQLSTDLESLEISCRQKNSRLVTTSHISVQVQAYCCTLVPSCLIHLCARLREGFLFWTLCLKTFHLGTVCVCLAWSSPLPRYCCCVDCLHCDLDIWYFMIIYLKLEIGDLRDLKYGVHRITGRGQTKLQTHKKTTWIACPISSRPTSSVISHIVSSLFSSFSPSPTVCLLYHSPTPSLSLPLSLSLLLFFISMFTVTYPLFVFLVGLVRSLVVELCVYAVSLLSCLSSDIQSHVGAFFATM